MTSTLATNAVEWHATKHENSFFQKKHVFFRASQLCHLDSISLTNKSPVAYLILFLRIL